MSGFAFHPEALDDLNDVWDLIAADSLDSADRIAGEIIDGIRALVHFPGQGHRRPDLTSRPLRFARVRDYLIAYAPEEDPLLVIAIIHGHRSPRVMAALLRGREL
jgi:toxin ParE1/3/4